MIGLSDSIHLLLAYRRLRPTAVSNAEAVACTFSRLCVPCLYTSLTTAVGFLCLLSTGIDIVIDFAVVTAVGIMLTYLYSILFVPAFLGFYTARSFNDRQLEKPWLASFLNWSRVVVRKHPRPILLLTVIVVAISAWPLRNLTVDVRMIDEQGGHPLVKDIEWAQAHGFGLFQVNLLLRSGERDVLRDAETLTWFRDLAIFADGQPLVLNSISPADYVSFLDRELAGLAASHPQLPLPTGTRVIEVLATNERSRSYFRDVYDDEADAAQMIFLVRDDGSVEAQSFLDNLRSYLAAHPAPSGTTELTGTVVLSQVTFNRLVDGFATSFGLALVIILVLLMVMLRSVNLALLALIPNILPLFLLLSLLGVLHIAITPAVVLVFSIAFGIAVDDSIHLLSVVATERKRGATWSEAVSSSYSECGRAIVFTTLVIALGFAVLLFSSFRGTYMLGQLTAIGVLLAVVADLFVFPSMMHALDHRR